MMASSGAFPVGDGVGVVRGHDDECPVARGRWRGEQRDEVLPGRGGVLGGADTDRRREHRPVVLPERQVGGGQVDHDAVWRRRHTYVLREHPCGRFVGSLGQSHVVPPRARGNHRQDRGGSLPLPRHGSRFRATWSGIARDGAVRGRDRVTPDEFAPFSGRAAEAEMECGCRSAPSRETLPPPQAARTTPPIATANRILSARFAVLPTTIGLGG